MSEQQERAHLEQIRQSLAVVPRTVEECGRLVGHLEALCSLLERVGDPWKRRFHGHWATLEEVFAAALHCGATVLDKEGTALVADAMTHLRSLTEEALIGTPADGGKVVDRSRACSLADLDLRNNRS